MDVIDQSVDPLGVRSMVVNVKQLQRWSDTEVPEYDLISDSEQKINTFTTPPFPCNEKLNSKIVLWPGDITKVDATAIVSSTNESMTDKNPIAERIFSLAGPDLKHEISTLRVCRTGEARLTKGYDLPARYIIHTVGPRYNAKYVTAAESALYSCYRSVMQIVRELNMSSVALCCINSERRGYPPEDGAHIAIRTIRRFLEKFGDTIETVVFALTEADEEHYIKLLPLYFPRTDNEVQYSLAHLPNDIGNALGEPVIPDRQIRITDKPTILAQSRLTNGDEFVTSININEEFATSVQVGKHAFAKMEADLDSSRRQTVLHGRNTEEQIRLEMQRRYDRWLKLARQTDLSEIAALKCLYHSGSDRMGHTVITFVGKNFPASKIDLEKALLYFVHVMDPLVSKGYSVVYIHTQVSRDNQPQMAFLKQVYKLVDHKYKTNLKAIYIIHPTFWARVMTWLFTTFTASTIKNKIHHVQGVEYLYSYISPDQVDLPQFVYDFDIQKNGKQYFDWQSSLRGPDSVDL